MLEPLAQNAEQSLKNVNEIPLDFWIYIAVGVIVLAVAVLAYLAGKRAGSSKGSTDDCNNYLKLHGLSPQSKDWMRSELNRRHIWEEKRGPNRHKFKPVHCD
jgi:hypothetical protein